MSRTDEELCEAVCAYPDDTGEDRGRRALYDLGRADQLAELAGELPSSDALLDAYNASGQLLGGIRNVATLAAAHARAALARALPSDDDLFYAFIVVPEVVDGLRTVATLAAAHATARAEAEIARTRAECEAEIDLAGENVAFTIASVKGEIARLHAEVAEKQRDVYLTESAARHNAFGLPLDIPADALPGLRKR